MRMMVVTLIPPKQYQTKEEYVYDVLRSSILNCDLKPGEKLVMDRLSEELGTSPIPLRSALQRLQSEGLVEITPHSGAAVSSISISEITEIFALLETLERTAYRVAAQRATDDELQRIDELVTRMDGAAQIQNTRLWSELNTAFHLRIAEITGMKLLIEYTRRTLDQWIRLSRCYFAQIGSLRMEQAQAEHRQILAWLQQQNLESLEQMAIQHNRLALQAYQELIVSEQISD
ncbi:MAG TPA: hypothetical protein DEH22_14795 [Chloroflexi bacterium]|nr:hypothetical protein [Chloroflexota bacterium]